MKKEKRIQEIEKRIQEIEKKVNKLLVEQFELEQELKKIN